MNLREGTSLQGGKYRIERELGHGGFGVTYLATQIGLNRRVAIKEFFMREYCNRDADTSQVSVGSEGSKELVEKFRKKFIKEAQNIACLKHPHIISIHDVFEDNGTAYYVMEYLDRGSLADLVKQRGRLPEADALRYIRQIADALSYIHARKMNHLDVKPGNILVDETDGAVLIDFGLSKRYDDEGKQTSTTPVGISHGYAPLEQYKKSGVGTFSPATDIYSLGATFYKLITGSTPPDANDVSEDGLPPFPSFVSSTVATAIEQAMQPRRKDRPQSVDAFLALLDAEVDEATQLDDTLRASLGTPPSLCDTPSMNRGGVVEVNLHPEGEHPANCPSVHRGTSPQGGGSSKRSAEKQSSLKKFLLPTLACVAVAVALVVVFWPKGGDAPVKEEERQEILPPAGRQNDTNQQQQQQQTSQQQSAPVKEEPAAPTTTPLYVTTTPSGVTVYVDGKKVGTTPIEGKEIARGSHKVKLSKEGYEDKTLTHTFGDKAVTINETLVAISTTTPLYVTTTPSGASVYIDGKKVGTTPIEGKEIARGSHKVKLSKEGYEDKTLTHTFGDKAVTINETLVAISTTTPLYVTTTPSGASVYIDGKKVGTTPIEGKEIARGSHKVKLSKEGYEDKTLTHTFGDKAVTINETLVVIPTTTPLYVTTTPSGASVYIDGKKVGTTPIEDKEIARGSHKVRLSKEGYEDKTLTRTFGDKPVVINETLAETPKPQPQVQPQQPSAPVASSSSSSAPATTGKINGHEYVDLGLSVKWATCNVGASSPSDYGNYYAWGETSTKSEYTEANSNTNKKSMGSIAGNASYDAARANWGGTWRLPTEAEFRELVDKCTWTWTTQVGHTGYKVTGKNGNSIFLPAAGWRLGKSLHRAGVGGFYWSATPDESGTQAYYLDFYSGYHVVFKLSRYFGYSVRPVSE